MKIQITRKNAKKLSFLRKKVFPNPDLRRQDAIYML